MKNKVAKTTGKNDKDYKPILFIKDENEETALIFDLQSAVKHFEYIILHFARSDAEKLVNKHLLYSWQEIESKCKIALAKSKFPKKIAFKNSEATHFYSFMQPKEGFLQGNYLLFLWEVHQNLIA
jgi:hypothetical protein